jgi:hypothetical protein
MDHPDPHVDGVQRRSEFDRLAGDVDFTLIRVVLAEEDFHQSCFPGAILSQDRMDLTRSDLEVDMIIGDPRKCFVMPFASGRFSTQDLLISAFG